MRYEKQASVISSIVGRVADAVYMGRKVKGGYNYHIRRRYVENKVPSKKQEPVRRAYSGCDKTYREWTKEQVRAYVQGYPVKIDLYHTFMSRCLKDSLAGSPPIKW